jgi:hypothetical protein
MFKKMTTLHRACPRGNDATKALQIGSFWPLQAAAEQLFTIGSERFFLNWKPKCLTFSKVCSTIVMLLTIIKT